MFRCKNSQICLHLNDLCDGYEDCPHSDDEILCVLHKEKCIASCLCLNFAIFCSKTLVGNMISKFSYVSYHIEFAELSSSALLFKNIHARHINLPHNFVNDICTVNKKPDNLNTLNVSYNALTKITKGCFSHLAYLNSVDLSYNSIHSLHQMSFNNISNPLFIDLGHNNIGSIPNHVFFHVVRIQFLSLINNPLNNIEAEPFLQLPVFYVKTTKYQICCVTSPKVICNATKPWSFSCFELLPAKTFKLAFVCVSCCVIVINIFSFLWNVGKVQKHYFSQRTKDTTAGPYNIIICFLYVGHTLFGICILVIWASDQYFGQNIIFQENQWINSFFCSSAFILSLFYSLIIPLSHLFLSLSRLMVVKSPFESKFKSAIFVSKNMMIITIFVFLFTVSTTIIFKHHVGVPSRTCLPYGDVDNPA